jgi:zinc transporter ZupT
MAFGGGALLAALTIDLIVSDLEKGHLAPLATGCLSGGLLFVLLNDLVNDYGGFIRKAPTTIYHLRKQSARGAIRALNNLKAPRAFKGLSLKEYRALAASPERRDDKRGDLIERWRRKTQSAIKVQSPLPALGEMSFELTVHKGAPLAIWLGILLDGIPESLVIGASLVSHSGESWRCGLL